MTNHPILKGTFALLAAIPAFSALSHTASPQNTSVPQPRLEYVTITEPTTTVKVWLVNESVPPSEDRTIDVLLVQQALRQLGYKVGVDGVYGPQTEAQVRRFQEDHHLFVDGIVGPVTAKALGLETLGQP